MIPFIANPTELVGAMPLHLACARPLCRLKAPLGLSLLRKRGLVEKYRAARIYSPWRFLPPRNTPDSFCRLLHPTKSIAALRGRYFSFMVTCRGGGPSILLTQDRSVAQKPHWGFHCCATAAFCFPKKQKIRTLLLLRKGSDFHYLVRWKGLEPPAY